MQNVIPHLKKSWSRYPILEIKNYEHNPEQSISDFILDVITKHNKNNKTPTITKLNKKQVSTMNSRRSFIDMWGLCRNYYKGCTLEEVCITMLDLVKDKKIYGNWFCQTINRYVFSDMPNSFEPYSMRFDRVNLNGTIRLEHMIEELGYTKEDFLIKKGEPKKEPSVSRRSATQIFNTVMNTALEREFRIMYLKSIEN
jgi:hypothetical protein